MTEIVMSISEETEIISAVVSAVAVSMDLVVDIGVISAVTEQFDIFQIFIMEFISSKFSELTIEQELSISLALLNFDFRSMKVRINNYKLRLTHSEWTLIFKNSRI